MSWNAPTKRWHTSITHSGGSHNLGYFTDDQEAARAFDVAARRVRRGKAHGGRSGVHWHRLNFPTAAEEAFAEEKGMPARKKRTAKA